MEKKHRVIKWVILSLLISWMVAAQTCNKMRVDDATAIKDFKKSGVILTTHTEKINGCNLHYVSTGVDTLPTLVFMHGSPGSWSAFQDYLKDNDLQRKYHLIGIDRPGFGFSDYGNAEHMDKQAEIIAALLHKLKRGRPLFLVGHSLGGPLVVEVAANNPGLVNGLVLLAASVDPKEEKSEKWRYVLAYTPLRYLIPAFLRVSNDDLMYFKGDVLQMPVMLSKIKCSVHILHGNHDSLVPYANALYAKDNLVNASSVELITLQGEDHFIPWTNYKDIKKVLMELN